MSRKLRCHDELTDGVGKCSVPMWIDECPAGFCDATAFGPQEPGQRRYGDVGPGWTPGGRWYPGGVWTPGYCSGLACYAHGGPLTPAETKKTK